MGKPPFLRLSCLLSMGLLLAACAANPQGDTPAGSGDALDAAGRRDYPARPFPTQTFYELLVAEFAGMRGDLGAALDGYVEQARAVRDPGVAERACKIAGFLDDETVAAEMCTLWAAVAPEETDAGQFAVVALIASGQFEPALEQATDLLARGVGEPLALISAYAENLDSQRRGRLLARFQQLRKTYPENRELRLGLVGLLQQQGDTEAALAELRVLAAANPDDEALILLHSQLLYQDQQPAQALALLKAKLAGHPDSKQLRLQYIRLLALTDLPRARADLVALAERYPDDADLQFSLALLNREAGLRAEASALLNALVAGNQRVEDAHLQLGLMAEEARRLDEAIGHYRAIRQGRNVVPATARLVHLLAEQDRLPLARLYLHQLRIERPALAVSLYRMEAGLLVDEGDFTAANQLLAESLTAHPNNIDLLYTRSLVSEKLRDMAAIETDLRAILSQDADNSAALNALGYTLANFTQRYDEAHDLIERALQLSPRDPAILDSFGWVLYRQGRHREAVTQLRAALAMDSDAEIAAHLGEVLWVSGKQDEAREVWSEALQQSPDNAVLKETLERLHVGL